MDMWNLGSKESVVVKYVVFKLCFEGNWYSVILLSQDGFESDYPENNFVKSVPK